MTTAYTAQSSTEARVLYMALELGWDDWTVGFTVGLGQAPRQVSVQARDLQELLAQIAHAKRRFDLPAEAPVHSVYEAGRDGFWLHRFLLAHGVQNVVVDAASIAVNRRSRRSKTDKLDGQKLLTMLVRFVLGETRLWKVVRVPSTEDEVLRQPQRELIALKEERTQHIHRMKGLLAGLGLAAVIDPTCPASACRPAASGTGTRCPRCSKSVSCESALGGLSSSARSRTWKMRKLGWSATTSSGTWSRCGR